jgi:bile acid:Na+ symporter, BASS family
MNNNDSGLVLASVALVDHLKIVLPIIVYSLAQHLFAAVTAVGFLRLSNPKKIRA